MCFKKNHQLEDVQGFEGWQDLSHLTPQKREDLWKTTRGCMMTPPGSIQTS